jgi:hypothetical protein
MKKYYLFFIPFIITTGLFSCSSRNLALLKKPTFQAVELRDKCIKNGIKSPVVEKADSLYKASKKILNKKNDLESYYLMRLAAAYYFIAFSQHKHTQKISNLEAQLINAQKDIKTYKDALDKVATQKED